MGTMAISMLITNVKTFPVSSLGTILENIVRVMMEVMPPKLCRAAAMEAKSVTVETKLTLITAVETDLNKASMKPTDPVEHRQ